MAAGAGANQNETVDAMVGGFPRMLGSFISWRDRHTPVPKEIIPQLAFDRLFRMNRAPVVSSVDPKHPSLAASLQRDETSAMSQAQAAAGADVGSTCSGPVSVRQLSAGFQAGGLFTVEVSCRVRGLAMLGLDVGTQMSGRSTAPLDPYRRAS